MTILTRPWLEVIGMFKLDTRLWWLSLPFHCSCRETDWFRSVSELQIRLLVIESIIFLLELIVGWTGEEPRLNTELRSRETLSPATCRKEWIEKKPSWYSVKQKKKLKIMFGYCSSLIYIYFYGRYLLLWPLYWACTIKLYSVKGRSTPPPPPTPHKSSLTFLFSTDDLML